MRPVECSGMRLLGQHDLGGRGNCGEGTALLQRAGKRYLYLAHESGPVNFAPPASKTGAIQINDVYVAADGVVYAVDRGGGGLYILQFDTAA